MLIRLNAHDSAPIYLQVAAAIRRALVDGGIVSGERLPSARVLAETLGVNMHTVLRGYAELEREGLVEMRRSRGAIVCADAPSRAHLHELLRLAAAEAARLGIADEDLATMILEAK